MYESIQDASELGSDTTDRATLRRLSPLGLPEVVVLDDRIGHQILDIRRKMLPLGIRSLGRNDNVQVGPKSIGHGGDVVDSLLHRVGETDGDSISAPVRTRQTQPGGKRQLTRRGQCLTVLFMDSQSRGHLDGLEGVVGRCLVCQNDVSG